MLGFSFFSFFFFSFKISPKSFPLSQKISFLIFSSLFLFFFLSHTCVQHHQFRRRVTAILKAAPHKHFPCVFHCSVFRTRKGRLACRSGRHPPLPTRHGQQRERERERERERKKERKEKQVDDVTCTKLF